MVTISQTIRDKVSPVIENPPAPTRTQAPTSPAPVATGSSDPSGDPKPQNSNPPKPLDDNTQPPKPLQPTAPTEMIVEEKKSEEISDEQRYEEMSDQERELDDTIKLKGPDQPKAKTNQDKNIGKVKDNFEDPDYGEPEKGKFEIKEGDIIDYMFKEIFLASCNWVGDKATGYIGLGAYRTGSWLYHNPGKWTVDTFKAGWNDTFKNNNKIRKDSELTDQEKNLIAKDSTTRFAKETFAAHESKMKINPILANEENIEKIIEAIGNGKVDNIEELPDEFKKKIKNIPPEILAQISSNKEGFRQVMQEKAAEYMVLNTFANNYATARLLNDKNNDKDAHNGQNVAALHEMYRLEGKKLMLISISEGKDATKLNESALEALNVERDNIRNEQYNENGKKPKENKALNKLQNMFNKSESRDNSEEQLLSDAYGPQQQQTDQNQQRRLDDANRDVDAADADRADHDSRPRPRERNNTNSNEEKKPTVISMNRGQNTK